MSFPDGGSSSLPFRPGVFILPDTKSLTRARQAQAGPRFRLRLCLDLTHDAKRTSSRGSFRPAGHKNLHGVRARPRAPSMIPGPLRSWLASPDPGDSSGLSALPHTKTLARATSRSPVKNLGYRLFLVSSCSTRVGLQWFSVLQ